MLPGRENMKSMYGFKWNSAPVKSNIFHLLIATIMEHNKCKGKIFNVIKVHISEKNIEIIIDKTHLIFVLQKNSFIFVSNSNIKLSVILLYYYIKICNIHLI